MKTNVKKFSLMILLMVVSFWLSFLLAGAGHDPFFGICVCVIAIIGIIVGTACYGDKIDQWLEKGHGYGSTTHIERLSGRV